jgi:energy-coupling factor transport system substrate-specific component
MGPDYVAAFDRIVSVTALWIYNGSTLVCGLLGGLLGSLLLKKHFVKAGLA